MHWTQIEEGWPHLMQQAALKWKRLTTEDLTFIGGRKQNFVRSVHMRYGLATVDAEEQVERWASALESPCIQLPSDRGKGLARVVNSGADLISPNRRAS